MPETKIEIWKRRNARLLSEKLKELKEKQVSEAEAIEKATKLKGIVMENERKD